ncbi:MULTISPECIES: 50S ribosomal protein L6 [Methylovorus]|jgi:large subunit ribosomal protein L6|uniref:Large ribosomal subunit protein uL6 n=1 Tax=Methylovorus glucosotrophus (strain SIP3-4) TaxID=582744 RepID=C6X8U6_METGS|nr:MULTISPECIES: 50S ribosomal protein L6 [Methylovorus]ACT49566.1 ribosomal protein L6 [Methylovorus glucosotrophus SIP3-4]ADQ83518.1 ribosomal protein L6 [Methylovorus sp. MP688]KAF0836182.1 large subunit ribosomal protein L6 [Methylovorus glucosotrophus]
MSRVAKNPVAIPAKVEVALTASNIAVSGPLGKLNQALTGAVNIVREGDNLTFAAANDSQHSRAMSGTVRALVANMVQGVSQGFTRKLNLVGVGYKAQAQGATLNLDLGFSHPINHKMPEGVTVQTPTQTEILLTGVDKQVVGQVAAQIRAYRSPEPYKGKGVRYSDEVVTIKETKKK